MTALEKLTQQRDEVINYLESNVRLSDRVQNAARSRLRHIDEALAYLKDDTISLSCGAMVQLNWAYA